MIAAVAVLINVIHQRSNQQIDQSEIRRYRTDTGRALRVLGGIWALAILAFRARQEAIASLPGEEPFPDGMVLTYGLVLAVIIAAMYLPADHNLDVRARQIVGTMGDPTRPELARRLGLDQTPAERLQKGLAIAAPLLAALASLIS